MAHDTPPEDETLPNAIRTAEDARIAAQCIMDYADVNLSMMEAADVPRESCILAQATYDAAKALVEALSK